MPNSTIVAPSLLAANFANLLPDIRLLNDSKAAWFHLDVMDGHFVPNISFGLPIIESIRRQTDKILDVHLMIEKPDLYLADFKNAGADILTVHFEACSHLHRTVESIKKLGCQVGVALNPHTPVNSLSEIISELDMVVLMSVNPGFGGQKFIENTYQKIKDLRSLSQQKNALCKIQIDGGVDLTNYQKIKAVGGNVLVAGSAIFHAKDPASIIEQLLS